MQFKQREQKLIPTDDETDNLDKSIKKSGPRTSHTQQEK